MTLTNAQLRLRFNLGTTMILFITGSPIEVAAAHQTGHVTTASGMAPRVPPAAPLRREKQPIAL